MAAAVRAHLHSGDGLRRVVNARRAPTGAHVDGPLVAVSFVRRWRHVVFWIGAVVDKRQFYN